MRLRTTRFLALPLILALSSALASSPDGHSQVPHAGAVGHAAEPAVSEHRDCHQHKSPAVEQPAGAKADELQATDDSAGRKTRPSNITRKRGPRR